MTPPYDQAPPASPPSGEPGHADRPALKRSGSEKRQRCAPISVRLLPDERAAVKEKARAAGLKVAAFLRLAALGTAGPRARRAAPVNAAVLGEATTALNRLGNNFNQIAHALNAGGAFSLAGEYAADLAEVRRTLRVMREAAAGRTDCHDNQGQSSR